MDYVIQPETLIGWINSDKEVVIIDVRSDLKNPDQKEQNISRIISRVHIIFILKRISLVKKGSMAEIIRCLISRYWQKS